MTDDMPKRIELLFQDAVDNLRFVKQQQWTVTNYAFLAYSALVALAQLTGSKLLPVLYYALALAWFYSAAMLALLLVDIEKFRRRIGWVAVRSINDRGFPSRRLDCGVGYTRPHSLKPVPGPW
jgi:hypothetical protein